MKLTAHQGWAALSNHVLRCHVALSIPEKNVSGVWCAGQKRFHVQNDILVFDDSQVHSGFNFSDKMTQTNKFDINKPYCITELDVKNMLAYDKNWIDNEWDGKFDALYRAINDGDYKDIPYMLYTGTKEQRHQLHEGLGLSFKHWSFDFAGYPNRIMVIVNNETNFSKYFMQPSCGNLPVLYFNKASAERIEDLRECYAIYHRAMNNVVPDTDDWAESVRDRVNQEFGYAFPEEVEE